MSLCVDKGSQRASPNFSPSVYWGANRLWTCLQLPLVDFPVAGPLPNWKSHCRHFSRPCCGGSGCWRKHSVQVLSLCWMRMYILLHIHINIWTKQIPRSLIKLVHTHVTGKRAAFAWVWSVGIEEYGCIWTDIFMICLASALSSLPCRSCWGWVEQQ